mmetsp:Transcript_12426/g.33907  ORF Transcript_12426/g.33907 Transcript_12426/m.33907 type:complete len:226 (-) Transcript_12426:479-1156(-)
MLGMATRRFRKRARLWPTDLLSVAALRMTLAWLPVRAAGGCLAGGRRHVRSAEIPVALRSGIAVPPIRVACSHLAGSCHGVCSMAVARTQTILVATALDLFLDLLERLRHLCDHPRCECDIAATSDRRADLRVDLQALAAHIAGEAEGGVDQIHQAIRFPAQFFLDLVSEEGADAYCEAVERRVGPDEGEEATWPETTNACSVVVLASDDRKTKRRVQARVPILP